jgi:HEAT repeat protein
MDDTRVAQLLATTLAIEGQATERLATVFNTIATDDDRKHRVLTMTRRMLAETDFGRQDAFRNLWSSMEELLLTYNERPSVAAGYRSGLDQVGARAEQMASDVPADLVELVDTLGQDNVRRLSVRLLIDLLKLERDPGRAPEVASDVAVLAEDLLLAGDYESVLAVIAALQEQAADAKAVTSQGSRLALESLVNTIAFVEAAELLGDMSEAEAALFTDVCGRIGPASTDALKTHLEQEALTPGRARATAIVRRFGSRAVSRLSSLAGSGKWAAQRNVAELLGEIAAPEAVPLLQPLLRGQDSRVTTAAVRALANIKDPAAARAVHTVMRAATGEQRRAVVEALVAQRDPRVVPVLVRMIEESDPFGADHPIVLEAVGALSRVGDDQAVPALTTLMRKKKLLARAKGRALKENSLAALRAIHTPAAERAIDEAAKTGDRMLRKLARAVA